MENKETAFNELKVENGKFNLKDIATTILGAIIILWAMAMFTMSTFTEEIKFEIIHCAGFMAFGVYLIWFKGDQAKALFEKFINKKIEKK